MNHHATCEKSPDVGANTGESGSHPWGTGIGAITGGSVLGAGFGSAAGSFGSIAGVAIGAIMGGLMGRRIAERNHPTRGSKRPGGMDRRPIFQRHRIDDFRHV